MARAITEALQRVEGETRLLVENTAGAGATFGRTARAIGDVLSRIPAELRSRTGYGLDTCHLFAAGYDLSESPGRLRAVLDEFEEAMGQPPSFFHLNDSSAGMDERSGNGSMAIICALWPRRRFGASRAASVVCCEHVSS